MAISTHILLFVLLGSLLTQPLTHPSRWITWIFETTILSTLTSPKAKVKAKVNLLTKVKARAKKDKVKDQAKEKANLKAKKNAPPPLLLPYMPQQPKGKARNNPTTQPPLPLPFQWPGLSLWQVPPYFLSIISPPSAHPHGPACHCGSFFFFLIAGCIGSLGYWQSLATRESKTQHQWYCIPKESQVPIHYDLRHHNLCMTWRMVH